MSYQHVTQSQRYQVGAMHKVGVSVRHTANVVKCHHSSVARELKRNRDARGYSARAAQKAVVCRHVASSRPRIEAATWTMVVDHLRQE